jgi:hypothetical protein
MRGRVEYSIISATKKLYQILIVQRGVKISIMNTNICKEQLLPHRVKRHEGLKKTQELLKKPAGRLNTGLFQAYMQAFSRKMSIFGGQYQ